MNFNDLLAFIARDSIALVFVPMMLVLFGVDLLSYFGKRHLDCKAILTSMGILATFMGIFSGLYHFSVENIHASVPALLEGLKFAFLLSIMGLMLAVTLHIVQVFLEIFVGKQVLRESPEQKLLRELIELEGGSHRELMERLQALDGIQGVLEELRADIYEHRRRFNKLGPAGEILTEQAESWAAVQDMDTGLTWEHKTAGGEHDQARRFAWMPDEERARYVAAFNQANWAGFSDWRLPTIAELQTIFVAPSGPDRRYFGLLTDPLKPAPFIFSEESASADATRGLAAQRDTGTSFAVAKAHIMLVRGH